MGFLNIIPKKSIVGIHLPVPLEIGIEGGELFLITRIPSRTERFTGSHLLLMKSIAPRWS